MPGYNLNDPELEKLFAEAGNAVKKAQHAPPKPAEPEPPKAAAVEVATPSASAELAEPVAAAAAEPAPVPVTPPPAARPAGGAVQLKGGTQSPQGLSARTDGGPTDIAWNTVRALALGRVESRQMLALLANGTVYYFADDGTDFRGLLTNPATTSAMNWRGLINELSEHIPHQNDPGLSALVGGGGGMIPRYPTADAFFNHVRTLGG